MNKKTYAVILIILSVFFTSTMIASFKLAQLQVNIFTVALISYIFGLIIISPIIIKSNFSIFKTKNLKLHFVRSSINLPAMLLGFGSISFIPIEKIYCDSIYSAIYCYNISCNFFERENLYL